MSANTLPLGNISVMSSEPTTAEAVQSTAAAILKKIEFRSCTLDDAIDEAPEKIRRTLEHLLFTFFRRKKMIDGAIDRVCSRPPQAEVKRILETALTQCFFQSAIPAAVAVDVAVNEGKKYGAGTFVNGVLRNLLRQKPEISDAPEAVLPERVLQRWRKRFSDAEVQGLASAFLSEAPFTFRLCGDTPLPEGFQSCGGFGKFRFAAGDAQKLLQSPKFSEGGYYVQDPATGMALSLAGELSGVRRALDLCAAPGGKTLMLAELLPPNAELVAADPSASRQRRTKENFERAKRKAQIVVARPEELYGQYDFVLADVPCSNTGVFRRRPDALWRFDEEGEKRIVELQREILTEAVRLTAPGGKLLVSSCSIELEENEEAAAFLTEKFPEMKCESFRRLLPSAEHDGAFGAMLTKR